MKTHLHHIQNHLPPRSSTAARITSELLRTFSLKVLAIVFGFQSLTAILSSLTSYIIRFSCFGCACLVYPQLNEQQIIKFLCTELMRRRRSDDFTIRNRFSPPFTTLSTLPIYNFKISKFQIFKSLPISSFKFLVPSVFLLSSITSITHAQNPDGSRVNWMTIEEAAKACKEQPRPVLMDFYTDWCGWCKRMMATTYADENVAAYINRNFYPVKFDAEGKDTVMFQGKKYMPVSNAPRTTHPLAAELLQGNMMYPTTLFMNNYDAAKDEFPFKLLVPGYLDQKKIEPFLVYTLENVYRTTPAEEFSKTFERAFYDTTVNALIGAIPWKQPREVFDGNFQSDKKRLVFIHTSWCNSCRVMERGVFTDTLLKPVLDSLVMVDFNPENTDPLFWNNTLYQRKANDNFPFHPLTLDLTRKNFVLPSIVVLDEKEAIIDAIPFYLPPSLLKDILIFYSRDIYKHKSWADFRKEIGK